MSDIYGMSDTWNAGGTTFSAIKMDVTNTASAAGSMLLDLRIAGAGIFQVRKDGLLSINAGTFGTPALLNGAQSWTAKQANSGVWSTTAGFEWCTTGSTNINLQAGASGVFMAGDMGVLWNSQNKGAGVNIFGGGSTDTGIVRDGAGIVRVSDGSTGGGSFKTADPTSGNGPAWKFGALKSAVVALDTANYVEISIAGVIYKLLKAA